MEKSAAQARFPSGNVGQLARLALMYVATVLTHGLTFVLWNASGDTQMLLLAGPMLLPVLLHSPHRQWPIYGLGWVLGLMTLAAVRGYPLPGMALAYVLALLMVCAATLVFGMYRADRSIDDFPRLLWLLLITAAVLPFVAAGTAVALAGQVATSPWLHKPWQHMLLPVALGFVLLTPAILSLANASSCLRRDGWPKPRVALITASMLFLIWLGWRELGEVDPSHPLLFVAPAPLLIYVALRAQIPGVSLVTMTLGVLAVQLSSSGHGPFLRDDPKSTIIAVQLWMLGMAVVSLFFAALVEQRRAAQSALLASGCEVQQLAGQLIVAQEQERARIARDLHDDINQRLAVVSMRLSALRQKIERRHHDDVKQLQGELMALSSDIRQLSHGLHPSMLAQIGLADSLGELCRSHQQGSGPRIELRMSSPFEELPDDVALCLYRVTQEALGNALRHAEAKRIEIVLHGAQSQIELTVTDDGKGFDTTLARQGLGIMSIGERVRLLGGSYQLRSTPHEGTQWSVHIPLAH
jgi:signal transduction histidine kinase